MNEPTTTPVGPTTQQLVAAFASSLLPLAGPAGVAIAAVIPAAEQFIANLRSQTSENVTVDQLVAIVNSGNAHLATLQRHSDEAAARERQAEDNKS